MNPSQRSLLLLKLLLVPSALLVISLVGKHFGPRVAGWLAGLPVVAGPILFVLALENGSAFAAAAATASTAAVFGSVAFSLAYARIAQRASWPAALAVALLAWLAAAALLALMPGTLLISVAIAIGTLLIAPFAFPTLPLTAGNRHIPGYELGLRMAAGAVLTLAVSAVASLLGSRWSGLLAVFPVLGSVLAVYSQRANGAAFACALLRAMATGLYSFVAFCAVLAVLLQQTSIGMAFGSAAAASMVVQLATIRYLKPRAA